MAFLTDRDFEDLPDDDGEAFAKLEAISRDRLLALQRDGNDNIPYEELMGYMNEVSALAAQFDVPDITYEREPHSVYTEFGDFTRRVEFRTVQIRAQRARRDRRNSVAVTGAARERIQHHIERLKAEIEAANIPDKRKRTLLDKISDFEAELAKKRFNLAQAMMVVALVAATANDFGGAYEGVSKIVNAISAALGVEKLEDEERQRLLPPPEPFKAIPDMRPEIAVVSFDANDDDVPF